MVQRTVTATVRENGTDSSWLRYLAVGAVLAAAYYALPHVGWGVVPRVVLYMVISASAPIAVFVGIARNRPRSALPWMLIGGGQAVYALADANFYVDHYLRHDPSYPATADVFYLLHHPLLAAGWSS